MPNNGKGRCTELQICESFLTIYLTAGLLDIGRWAHFNVKLHFLMACLGTENCAEDREKEEGQESVQTLKGPHPGGA